MDREIRAVLRGCINFIFLLANLFLLVTDVVKRIKIYKQKINENETKNNNNNTGHQKILNIWSLLTLIFATLFVFVSFCFSFPGICIYINPIYFPITCFARTFLTFYQISRIYYCFNHSRITKYLCIFLYLNGVIILIEESQIWLVLAIEINEQYCNIVQNVKYRLIQLSFLVRIHYLIWDIFVISLYIIKIKKLTNSHKLYNNLHNVTQNELNQQYRTRRYHNIRRFLYKTLFLTISFEFIQMVITVIKIGKIGGWAIQIIVSVTLVSCEMILLCEHNHLYYIKFIKFLMKFKLVICCQSFINKSIAIPKPKPNVNIQMVYPQILSDHKQIASSSIHTSNSRDTTTIQRSLAVNILNSTTEMDQ